MSSFAFRLAVLACAASLWLTGSAVASDLKEPYRIQIVVHVAKHRLLTKVFEEQLKRELQDGIQAALGKLAKVEVTDKHPKLADIRAHGLQKALDSWGNHAAADKVHFVLIDYSGVRYEIQTRQYDAQLRTASPTVRHEKTRDRAYVSRAAALLLEHDIGLVGTILNEPDKARQVRVEFRGGGLGVDLKRWLKKGEVLGLPPAPGEALPSALLVLDGEPKDGVAPCLLFSRYRLPRASGMKAALLGTRSGGLRIRLVEKVPGKPGVLAELQSTTVRLEFRKRGFEGEEATMPRPVTFRPGADILTEKFEEGRGRFDRVAFINVLSGETVKARIPVPLIDDRLVTLDVPPTNEAENDILERYHSFERNVRDAAKVMVDLFAEINSLTAKPEKRIEATVQVKQALQRGRDVYKRLSRERSEVEKEIEKLPAKDRPNMAGIDVRLAQIGDSENRLLEHIATLEQIEKEENDPEKRKWERLKADAKLREKELELGKALEMYEKIPEKFRTKELEKHVAALKKEWTPANDDHAKAREFIYDEYPKLTTEDLAALMEKDKDGVMKHFDRCKNERDRLGPAKLLRETEKHMDRIKGEGEKLKPTVNIEDEKPAKLIAELSPKLLKLHSTLETYLGKGKEKKDKEKDE